MENDVDTAEPVNKGTLAPGTMLDHYRLGKCLGVGGMGEVYYAVHEVLQTPCAIKIIRPEVAKGNSGVAARLIREARMACSVQHDNIVGVLDASATSNLGCPYIVMEYVDGTSVESYLDSGPMSEEDVIAVALGVTEALIAAAKYKIVHRDIKPANIMINSRGQVKLADLGIAKSDSAAMGGTLTQDNALLGTPNYAAPEQLRSSHTVDARADIYSLGATMYHLLSGHKPFDGDTVFNVLAKVVCEKPPTFEELGVKISPALEELVEKMMSKDPEQRPASALELKGMLQKVARGQRIGDTGFLARLKALPGTFRRLSRPKQAGAALAAVAVAALLGFGIFGLSRSFGTEKTPPVPVRVLPSPPAPPEKMPVPPAPAVKPKPAPAVKTPAAPPASAPAAEVKKTPVKKTPAAPKTVKPQTPPPVWRIAPGGKIEAFEPLDLSLEERLEQARKRLNVLQSPGKRERRGVPVKEKIAFRDEQIRFLSARLRLKREQQLLKHKKTWSETETAALKKELEEELERAWNIGGTAKVKDDITKKLIAGLQSGRIDANMTVRYIEFSNGSGPLLAAVLSGKFNFADELVKVLVGRKADFSVLGEKGLPELEVTGKVYRQMLPVVTDHIDSFSKKSSNLETLLLPEVELTEEKFSFGSVDAEAVKTQLLLGCAVDFKTPGQGQTPLHLAAFTGNAELVRLLLRAEASPDRENDFGQTPLFAAAMSGSKAVYDLLFQYTAAPGKKDIFGKTAEDRKWDGRLRRAVLEGNPAGAAEALRHKADPNTLYGSFWSPLLLACARHDPAMVKLLLKHGADPNGPGQEVRMKPLVIVSPLPGNRPSLAIFKLLVENGAATDIVVDQDRAQPLTFLDRVLFACTIRHRQEPKYEEKIAIAKYMLSCGKFENSPDFLKRAPLMLWHPELLAVAAAHFPLTDKAVAGLHLRRALTNRMPRSVVKVFLDRGVTLADERELLHALRMNNYADVIELFRGKISESQMEKLLRFAIKGSSDEQVRLLYREKAGNGGPPGSRRDGPRPMSNAEIANMLLGGSGSRPAAGGDELLSALYARRPRSEIRNLLSRRNGSLPDEKKLISALQVNNYADVIKLFRGRIGSDQVERLLRNADKRDSDRAVRSRRNGDRRR
ncbi:MAG: protein kinase [Lentisphaeria bacterium]|nr:protein kinase [Lentisphaeria bacterium]